MPLELVDIADLKEYCDSYVDVPVFYFEDAPKFVISAGKVSWSGHLTRKDEVLALEDWLAEKNAKRVRGWKDLSEIFL